jgi:hypothetical protein
VDVVISVVDGPEDPPVVVSVGFVVVVGPTVTEVDGVVVGFVDVVVVVGSRVRVSEVDDSVVRPVDLVVVEFPYGGVNVGNLELVLDVVSTLEEVVGSMTVLTLELEVVLTEVVDSEVVLLVPVDVVPTEEPLVVLGSTEVLVKLELDVVTVELLLVTLVEVVGSTDVLELELVMVELALVLLGDTVLEVDELVGTDEPDKLLDDELDAELLLDDKELLDEVVAVEPADVLLDELNDELDEELDDVVVVGLLLVEELDDDVVVVGLLLVEELVDDVVGLAVVVVEVTVGQTDWGLIPLSESLIIL